jgi:hypothetical protein
MKRLILLLVLCVAFTVTNAQSILQIGNTETVIHKKMENTLYKFSRTNVLPTGNTLIVYEDSTNAKISVGYYIDKTTKKCFQIVSIEDIKDLPYVISTFNSDYIKVSYMIYIDQSKTYKYEIDQYDDRFSITITKL